MTRPLSERVRQRLREAIDKNRFTQKELGEAAGYKESGISAIVNGRNEMPLHVIQAAAELTATDPGEWLMDPTSQIRVVDAGEALVLRLFGQWPPTVRESLIRILEYFADEEPAVQQLRKMHEHIRRMGKNDRDAAAALLLLMAEGRLSAEAKAQLVPTLPGGSVDAILGGLTSDQIEPVRESARVTAEFHRQAKAKKRLGKP